MSEVKQASDIADVISRYLDLKPAGGGRFKALCPFHREKTPSFHVNRERQTFYCFGCEKGGDVLTFLQEIDGLTFRDALQQLADRAGIKLASYSGQDARDADERPALFQAMSFAAKQFQGHLAAEGRGDVAREYLARRATPQTLIDRFGVGFAPDGWSHLADAARRAGIKEHTLDAAGLAKRGPNGFYDRFRNRVMFPIRDVSGKIVAFGGRTLGDDPAKYINSPESPIYRKGKVLYGLFEARDAMRKSGEAVLVEGYFDVMRCVEAGVENAVAPCGTALTDEQAATIRRYAETVIVVFDGDEAGIRAALRSVSVLAAAGLAVRATALPEGLDPDDFVRKYGAEALRRHIAEASGFVPFYARMNARRLESIEGRSQVATELFEVIRVLDEPLRQDEYVKTIAAELGLDEFRCKASYRAFVEGRQQRAKMEQAVPAVVVNAHDREFVSILLESPERAKQAWGELVDFHLEHTPVVDVLRMLAECPGLDPMQALESDAARQLFASAAAAAPKAAGERAQSIIAQTVLDLKIRCRMADLAALQEAMRKARMRGEDAEIDELTIKITQTNGEIERYRREWRKVA